MFLPTVFFFSNPLPLHIPHLSNFQMWENNKQISPHPLPVLLLVPQYIKQSTLYSWADFLFLIHNRHRSICEAGRERGKEKVRYSRPGHVGWVPTVCRVQVFTAADYLYDHVIWFLIVLSTTNTTFHHLSNPL